MNGNYNGQAEPPKLATKKIKKEKTKSIKNTASPDKFKRFATKISDMNLVSHNNSYRFPTNQYSDFNPETFGLKAKKSTVGEKAISKDLKCCFDDIINYARGLNDFNFNNFNSEAELKKNLLEQLNNLGELVKKAKTSLGENEGGEKSDDDEGSLFNLQLKGTKGLFTQNYNVKEDKLAGLAKAMREVGSKDDSQSAKLSKRTLRSKMNKSKISDKSLGNKFKQNKDIVKSVRRPLTRSQTGPHHFSRAALKQPQNNEVNIFEADGNKYDLSEKLHHAQKFMKIRTDSFTGVKANRRNF